MNGYIASTITTCTSSPATHRNAGTHFNADFQSCQSPEPWIFLPSVPGDGDDGGTRVAPWPGIPSAIQSLPAFMLQLMAQDYHLQPEEWKWQMAFLTALVWELFRMGFYEGMLARDLYSQNHEYDSR